MTTYRCGTCRRFTDKPAGWTDADGLDWEGNIIRDARPVCECGAVLRVVNPWSLTSAVVDIASRG